MRIELVILILIPLFSFSQMEKNQNGVAPGISAVFGKEETGVNLRFHYFPSHKMCFGIETNVFPEEDQSLTDNLEVTFNGHYIFEINERLGVYPLAGLGWKKSTKEEADHHEITASGWRALVGGGFHGMFGRFAPYTEYIYGAGFEREGIFIIGTFFTIEF